MIFSIKFKIDILFMLGRAVRNLLKRSGDHRDEQKLGSRRHQEFVQLHCPDERYILDFIREQHNQWAASPKNWVDAVSVAATSYPRLMQPVAVKRYRHDPYKLASPTQVDCSLPW